MDGVDVGSEVIEIVEGGVGEHKMEVCSGTLEAGAIRLRGDQPPVRIVGVKWADGVRPELHDLLESVIGGGGMSRPRANGVVGRVVVGGVPGLVIQNRESRGNSKAVRQLDIPGRRHDKISVRLHRRGRARSRAWCALE